MRSYTLFDRIIMECQTRLAALSNFPQKPVRTYPGSEKKSVLNDTERRHIAGLMRVNHSGEVCAQALYKGQAFTAYSLKIRETMRQAAAEEIDHLSWCEQRLTELNSHVSFLNPVWYAGSFVLGAFAGFIGDGWSLGFVEETEHQVVKHLDHHLQQVPLTDEASRAILQQMREDELHHATLAHHAGAHELPFVVKTGMRFTSKIMTTLSYWV